MRFGDRLKHAWNAFMNRDPPVNYWKSGPGYSIRPDRHRIISGNERTIVNSIYNRIGADCAAIDIYHVRLDKNDRYKEKIESGLNECLNLSATLTSLDVPLSRIL